MIVVKAKIASEMAMIGPPNPGKDTSKASEVSAAPVAQLVQTPVDRIASAVKEQTMIVSIKVPSMATRPWLTGPLVLAAACAIGAEPRPASFEKTPRATPKRIAAQTAAPANPPVAAAGEKAWVKSGPKALGMALALITSTTSDARI